MISSNLISNFISPPFEVSLDYWLLFLHGCTDAIIQLSKIDDLMKEETNNLREVIDALHLKHKEYVDGIQTYVHSHSVDQSEIKRLAGF